MFALLYTAEYISVGSVLALCYAKFNGTWYTLTYCSLERICLTLYSLIIIAAMFLFALYGRGVVQVVAIMQVGKNKGLSNIGKRGLLDMSQLVHPVEGQM